MTDWNPDDPLDLGVWDELGLPKVEETQRFFRFGLISTRKKTGERYPPKTIHMLLCGLQRYMKEKKERPLPTEMPRRVILVGVCVCLSKDFFFSLVAVIIVKPRHYSK